MFNLKSLVEDCLIPPYTSYTINLLTDLWVNYPFELSIKSNEIIKLFNKEVLEGR